MVEKGLNHVRESAGYGYVDAFMLVEVFSFKVALLCKPAINLDGLVAFAHKPPSPQIQAGFSHSGKVFTLSVLGLYFLRVFFLYVFNAFL